MNASLDAALQEVESRFIAANPNSAARHTAAVRAMPGGNTRTVLHFDPFPLCWARGEGTVLEDIDGHRYTAAAHAYDIYEHGGDWWLREKLEPAAFVHTSTDMARQALIERGVPAARIHCIRRGLDRLPPPKRLRASRDPLRLLAVARLVEKKGLRHQLRIHAALRAAGIAFEARIVGEGPLRAELERLAGQKALGGQVEQIELSGEVGALGRRALVVPLRRVEVPGAHPGRVQGVHLVVHQRDQRGDDDPGALPHQRRDLVAQGLAAAGGHEHHRVAAADHVVDHVGLEAAELVVPEDGAQHVAGGGGGGQHPASVRKATDGRRPPSPVS